MIAYVALIDSEAGNYGVVVPDLPGCYSAGDTVEDAIRNSGEALRLWIEATKGSGGTIPQPRSVEALRRDPEVAIALAAGGLLALVLPEPEAELAA
jgi:predicted RNase H-like HicB family nuclease